ncbi:MAG TPA: arsinothricin resistance N-acetyltransferase ArsN1 family B [Candidatus Dormibacteraeota bacterium]|nr:arsinothricin resistance N-acetyltransferase ArsN1 family B [Candidatus Dormibacteraeota bacterium]
MEIRQVCRDDAEAIAEIYAPIVCETTISFEEVPPDASEIAKRIASITATHPWLVAVDGSLIGYAYAKEFRARAAYRWSVECSVYVREGARGHGVGGALYCALFERLRSAEVHAVFTGIALPNDASIALHRSRGFEPVGIYREVGYKFDRWIDTSWWQRRL